MFYKTITGVPFGIIATFTLFLSYILRHITGSYLTMIVTLIIGLIIAFAADSIVRDGTYDEH